MCYLGYRSRAVDWKARKKIVKGSRGHSALAQENASHWFDLAAYAKERFNLCLADVIHMGLLTA